MNPRPARTPGVLALLLVVTFAPGCAPAALPSPEPWSGLAERAERADAVFYGEVVRVTYGAAEVLAEQPWRLPLTYVTYRVVEGFKGGREGEEVVLQFTGGQRPDGTVTVRSGTPTFDVGERDVLFVAGNGRTACPLVDCARGRLRVSGDRLFTDDGHALRLDADGALSVGERHALPEALEHTIGDQRFVRAPSRALRQRPDPDALLLSAFIEGLPVQQEDFAVVGLSVDPAAIPIVEL